MSRRPLLLRVLMWASCLAPVGFLIWFVAGAYVEIPMFDQWGLVPFFAKIQSGDVSFADLTERKGTGRVHVMVFPRLIIAVLAFATGWKIKYELFFSIGLAVTTFVVLCRIASETRPQQPSPYAPNLLTSLLLFSLVQSWNWRWGFSLMLFLVNGCVVLAAMALMPGRSCQRTGLQLLRASACCFVATFSMAHGVLSWFALIPSVTYLAGSRVRAAKILSAWLGLSAVASILFLWGYDFTGALAVAGRRLGHFGNAPPVFFEYMLQVLGTPIAQFTQLVPGDRQVWVAACGSILLAAYGVIGTRLLTGVPGSIRSRAVPWISIGLFSILYGGMNALGRATSSTQHLIGFMYLSMYSTPATLLSIAVAQLIFVAREWLEATSPRRVVVRFLDCAQVAIGLCVVVAFVVMAPEMIRYRTGTHALKSCFEVLPYLRKANTCLGSSIPLRQVGILEEIGFRRLRRDLVFIEDFGDEAGRIEEVKQKTEGPAKIETVTIQGRAAFPDWRAHPRMVFLAKGDERNFFAHALVDANHQWRVTLAKNLIPRGTSSVRAWAYDPDGGRFIPLGGPAKL